MKWSAVHEELAWRLVTISNRMPWLDDSNDAMIVAQHLGIPFQRLILVANTKSASWLYVCRIQSRAHPIPIFCATRNSSLMIFLNAACKTRSGLCATGHYHERRNWVSGKKSIAMSPEKTQTRSSYFLCQLTQAQLSKALFPVARL